MRKSGHVCLQELEEVIFIIVLFAFLRVITFLARQEVIFGGKIGALLE